MKHAVRLVSTLTTPYSAADRPGQSGAGPWPGRQGVLFHGGPELVAQDLGGDTTVFRKPNSQLNTAVSPVGDLAVFSRTRGLRAIEQDGTLLWEVAHGCWGCGRLHPNDAAEPDDPAHRYPKRGSVGFSSDGAHVWAHICGPLAGEDLDLSRPGEEWLVLDARTGAVLARAPLGTAAEGSHHSPHPEPEMMSLSIGEGQDGSALYLGRWDGVRLSVQRLDGDWVALAVNPSGRLLLAVDHDQQVVAVHPVDGSTAPATLSADVLSTRDDQDEDPFFDYTGGFLAEETAVVGTFESDTDRDEPAPGRHWLLDVKTMELAGRLDYPQEIHSVPEALGDGTWITLSAEREQVFVWALA